MGFWEDGPALIGWGGRLSPEEERELDREHAFQTGCCLFFCILIVIIFVAGCFEVVHFLAEHWPK